LPYSEWAGRLKGVTALQGKERSANSRKFKGMPLATLVAIAGASLGAVTIDETHDSALYDFNFLPDETKPIEDQLREQFGITITRERRVLPFTIIRQTSN